MPVDQIIKITDNTQLTNHICLYTQFFPEFSFEIIEHRTKHGSTIFCTQYEPEGWYERINPDPEQDSPIADAIMDRIINNSYIIDVKGKISMRERHGLKASANGKAGGKA